MRYDKVMQSYIKETGEFTLAAIMNRFEETDKEEAEECLFSLVKQGVLDYAPGFVYKYVGEIDPDEEDMPAVYQAFFYQIKVMTQANVCQELDLAEEDAEMLLERLVEKGLCQLGTEFVFRFTGKEGKVAADTPSFHNFFHKNDKIGARAGEKNFAVRFWELEQESQKDDEDDEEDVLAVDRKHLFGRREPERRRSFFDEDEDDEDRGFGRLGSVYDKEQVLSRNVCEDVLTKLEKLELKEQSDGLTVDEDMEKLTLETRKELLKAALSLGGTEYFEKTGDKYIWDLDIAYPNDTSMKFCLYYKGGVRISDCGLTMAFVHEFYNVSRERVRRELSRVFDEYAIEQEEDELYIKVTSDNAKLPMFFLFAAVEQLVNGLSDNLFGVVEAEIEARCTSVMKQIIFDGNVAYAQAKEKAESLLAEAQTNGSQEDKTVYKNVLDTLEDVTEANFERFVEQVITDTD